MPYFKSYEPIAEKVKELLSDRQALIKNSSDLIDLVKPLTEKSASVVVSNIAIDMIK
jgi:hypothetical protein